MHNPFKDIENAISDEQRRLADAAQRLANEANEKRKQAEQMIKDAAEKATAEAKRLAQKAIDDAKKAHNAFVSANKKVFKRLQDLAGKVRGAYKKLLRKAMLKMVYNSIRANVHGYATRLYPAIAPVGTLKANRFSSKFQPKAKKSYDEILAKWIELGGIKEKLDEAIMKGANVRIFKFKKNPYVAEKQQVVVSRKEWSVAKDHKAGVDGFGWSNLEGDDENMPPDNAGAADNIPISADENADLADNGATEAEPEEKHKKWHAFMAFMHHVFHKHEADTESPYVPPTADTATPTAADKSGATPNIPTPNTFDEDLKNDKPITDELAKASSGDINEALDAVSPKKDDSKDKGESKSLVTNTDGGASHKKMIMYSVGGAIISGAIAFFAFPSKRKFALPIAILSGGGAGALIGKKLTTQKEVEMPKNVDNLKVEGHK